MDIGKLSIFIHSRKVHTNWKMIETKRMYDINTGTKNMYTDYISCILLDFCIDRINSSFCNIGQIINLPCSTHAGNAHFYNPCRFV